MTGRQAFFDAVRVKPFGGSLTADQVSGMEAILDEWDRRGLTDLRHLAYMLATTFWEVARTMQPIRERGGAAYFHRMYDPHGDRPKVAAALGNTVPGDGARFHGRGLVQITGRRNYAKASRECGVDLLANPDRAMEPSIAVRILFAGMLEGWFTGKKLSDYINAAGCDYKAARRIINGTDKAAEIAAIAVQFERALFASRGKTPPPKPVPKPAIAAGTAATATAATVAAAEAGLPMWVAGLVAAAVLAIGGFILWRSRRG